MRRMSLLLAFIFILSGCFNNVTPSVQPGNSTENTTALSDLSTIPTYSGNPYAVINNNMPFFSPDDYNTTAFETFSPLDSLDRCGVAFANICIDIMPTEERGSIGSVKPSGWQTVKYDNVDGKYLYNRCHLIGFQLSGENANERNLITGTRYMNVEGMLPFENMVADYVEETQNHVLYRVTPVFEDNNLLASGVLMEAWSVEDSGDGICFNVFCYNVQPGIKINYLTGESDIEATPEIQNTTDNNSYVGNINTKKFHYPTCRSVKQMSENNKAYMNCTRDDALSKGYVPCEDCKP